MTKDGYDPDYDIRWAMARDGYDPNYDVRHTTPEKRDAYRDAIIDKIDREGLAVRPWMMCVGHGYHFETGDDQITISSHDEASRQMLTMVMPLWMARQVRDNLIEQVGKVEKLIAARPEGRH